MNTDTIACSELALKVDSPLLIVLTPYSPKNAWWRDRQGILSLLPDGVVDLNSDHINSGKTIGVSREYFKQAIRDGWSVYLAYCSKPTVWYEFEAVAWRYEPDRVIIPVDRSDFVLT
jgi:hypothetical protein